ncbi:MAG: lipoate--protein ligase family protein [Anaerolineae bacterium]|nr:lipoate--protein ligase family protein [Anaerolineae bacterium]
MRYPPATWRLLLEPHPRPGALNMAIDEAVLRAVAAGNAPPTLRLYGWLPPALTLGRGQPYVDADVVALQRDGIDLVRRMTGGTAVLNRDELTYAAVVSDDEPRFSGIIAESYQGMSAVLLCALAHLGLTSAEAKGRDRSVKQRVSRPRTPVCFEIPSDYEITVGGRKLVGSSQMRVRGAILQHGSLPLVGDVGDISAYLSERPDPARTRSLAMTLRDALGLAVSWKEAAAAVIEAVSEVLDLTLVESPLTSDERRHMEALLVEKYGNPAWTTRL